MVYKINTDWVLEIRAYNWNLAENKILRTKKEIEQTGQELYNLVTAIEVRH